MSDDDTAQGVPPTQAIARLEACCIAVGYMTDTARYEWESELAPEVSKLVALVRYLDEDAGAKLLALAAAHSSPWVRYFIAVHIATERPVAAVEVLGRIKEEGGLVAVQATLALHRLQGPSGSGTSIQ